MGIRRHLLEYVGKLKEALRGSDGVNVDNKHMVNVQSDESGWPRLVGFDPQANIPKATLEIILRSYLSKNYCEYMPTIGTFRNLTGPYNRSGHKATHRTCSIQ